MKTTSHFIGLSLDSSHLVDLFVGIQQYLKSHNLESIIEFQNILSTHITLYYLESTISESDKARILRDILELSRQKPVIDQLRGAYFGEPGKERVAYLSYGKNNRLEEINQFFAQKYNHSEVPENQLAFVAHVSLFRIHDTVAYTPHKPKIDALIAQALEEMSYDGLVGDLHLYQVSSLFHPEIQVPIRA
jgi:2'-5' RNA ligase